MRFNAANKFFAQFKVLPDDAILVADGGDFVGSAACKRNLSSRLLVGVQAAFCRHCEAARPASMARSRRFRHTRSRWRLCTRREKRLSKSPGHNHLRRRLFRVFAPCFGAFATLFSAIRLWNSTLSCVTNSQLSRSSATTRAGRRLRATKCLFSIRPSAASSRYVRGARARAYKSSIARCALRIAANQIRESRRGARRSRRPSVGTKRRCDRARAANGD